MKLKVNPPRRGKEKAMKELIKEKSIVEARMDYHCECLQFVERDSGLWSIHAGGWAGSCFRLREIDREIENF